MSIAAVQYIKRMRGGAQAHMLRCSDKELYVVKFLNNPQHVRVLANELLSTRLAGHIGLPVPATEIVSVDEWLIEHTPELCIQRQHDVVRCQPGLQFGSRYVLNPLKGQVFDYLPVDVLCRVHNFKDFCGMLLCDKWMGNVDGRQAAFARRLRSHKYRTFFIDQGHCFNAGEWTFPDHPLRGVYAQNEVYANVRGWDSFEPWLSRIENVEESGIWAVANEIPLEWYGARRGELDVLLRALFARRGIVRGLVRTFRDSVRNPFPQWSDRGGEADLLLSKLA